MQSGPPTYNQVPIQRRPITQSQANHVARRAVWRYAVFQLIIGILIITNGVAMVLTFGMNILLNRQFGCVWCGICFSFTGMLGMFSARQINNFCVNSSYMAFSIISSVASASSAISVILFLMRYLYFFPLIHQKALIIGLVVLMLFEMVSSIFASVYCCKNGCDCCGDQQQQTGVVIQPQPAQYQMVRTPDGQAVMTPAVLYPHASAMQGQYGGSRQAQYSGAVKTPYVMPPRMSSQCPMSAMQQPSARPPQYGVATSAPLGECDNLENLCMMYPPPYSEVVKDDAR